MQFGDSMLPTGAFAFSGALEAAVQKGVVRDVSTLQQYVVSALRQASTGDAVGLEHALRRLCADPVSIGGPVSEAALTRLLRLLPDSMHVEIETNGTIAPTPALEQRVNQWNISPKLLHSGNPLEKTCVPDSLAFFAALPHAWFKFVVQSEEDWAAIAALGLPQERIILMPCATTRAALEQARPAVVEMCLRHRVRLGDRLHLTLWDDKKGV